MQKVDFFEPLYQFIFKPTKTEEELMKTYWFQRLKYIHHAGADFTFSYKTHTRYQHSLGVYALACIYYPKNQLIRISALLHDIGHLPFSHAVENAYKTINNKSIHHEFSKTILFKTEIADILKTNSIDPENVYDLVEGNKKGPLKPKGNILGMDLFDCFIRDTYYSGELMNPSNIIKQTTINDNGINCNLETGLQIHKLILKDHNLMFNDKSIIRSGLAQRLFELVITKTSEKEMFKYTKYEVMNEVIKLSEKNKEIKKLLYSLLYTNNYAVKYLYKKTEKDNLNSKTIKFSIHKPYAKTVLVNMKPLSLINSKVKKELDELNNFVGTYEITEKE